MGGRSYAELVADGQRELDGLQARRLTSPEQRSAEFRRRLFAWARERFEPDEIGAAACVAPRLKRTLGRVPTPDEVREDPVFQRMRELGERARRREVAA